MKLTMLGTGNALVTECYNTCFAFSQGKEHFLVDAGGGNPILKRLKDAGIPLKDLHEVFLTHGHIDHLLGMIWLIRMVGQGMNRGTYEGDFTIYCHKDLIKTLHTLVDMMQPKKVQKLIDKRIYFRPVEDGETLSILGLPVTFFDIHSTKTKQYGCMMQIPAEDSVTKAPVKFTCLGDEPYRPTEEVYASGSDWLTHEAFCLYEEADLYQPYTKNHSTVRDACENAEKLGAKNLILYHTEDDHIRERKELYTAEGRLYYHGNLYVPDDMETFEL